MLKIYQEAYERGEPLISDAAYDKLCTMYHENSIGVASSTYKNKHKVQLLSLEKKFDDEEHSIDGMQTVESPKLDGCAVALWYEDGFLVMATKRGDGIEGDDCTAHFLSKAIAPWLIAERYTGQITGEVVMPKEYENARNKASGALGLKDLEEFKTRELYFVAYGMSNSNFDTYAEEMQWLDTWGFNTVLFTNEKELSRFPQDGRVIRLNNNKAFERMGVTAKFPKGAYARKLSCDVSIEQTVLNEVIWQVGKNGKVTPVAIFDEIIIDDAKINRATLHNAGFVEELDLHIGDTLLVTRSGGIIPKVLGKV